MSRWRDMKAIIYVVVAKWPIIKELAETKFPLRINCVRVINFGEIDKINENFEIC